jgi:hypothetical protein
MKRMEGRARRRRKEGIAGRRRKGEGENDRRSYLPSVIRFEFLVTKYSLNFVKKNHARAIFFGNLKNFLHFFFRFANLDVLKRKHHKSVRGTKTFGMKISKNKFDF